MQTRGLLKIAENALVCLYDGYSFTNISSTDCELSVDSDGVLLIKHKVRIGA